MGYFIDTTLVGYYIDLFLTCLNTSNALRILNQALARVAQLFTRHLKISSSLCGLPETNTGTQIHILHTVKIMECN